MTTNKPEVVAWYFPSSKTTLPVVSFNDRSKRGEPLIRFSDYDALQAENALLLAAIRRLCNIYVVDDYYDGQLREEHLESAVNRAINAVKETPK